MMSIIARQSTARIVMVGPILDADGVAVTDAAVSDLKLSKNGGAPAALNGSATLTHRHTGHYSLSLTTSDTDTVGQAEVLIDDTTNAMPVKVLTIVEEAVYDALFAASATGLLPANVTQISGSSTAADNAEIVFDTDFATNYNTTNDGWVVKLGDYAHGGSSATLRLGGSSATPALYITNSGGAAVKYEATGGDGKGLWIVGNGVGKGVHIQPGDTATGLYVEGGSTSGDAVVFTAMFEDSYGFACYGSGSSPGIFSAGGNNGGHGVFFTGGGGVGGDGLRIEGGTSAADIRANITGTLDTVTDLTNLPSIPNNWLTAAGMAADASGEIADAVWTETLADHSGTSGSTAEALNAAGSAGDPWVTALPGAYGAGSAGFILGTNLNATVSSRASQTSVDDIPTVSEFNARTLAAADYFDPATDTVANVTTVGSVTTKTGYSLTSDERNDIADAMRARQLTQSYNVAGTAPTLEQALFVCMQRLTEFSIAGTTITVNQLDGSTSAYTLTMDDDTNPTSSTRGA